VDDVLDERLHVFPGENSLFDARIRHVPSSYWIKIILEPVNVYPVLLQFFEISRRSNEQDRRGDRYSFFPRFIHEERNCLLFAPVQLDFSDPAHTLNIVVVAQLLIG